MPTDSDNLDPQQVAAVLSVNSGESNSSDLLGSPSNNMNNNHGGLSLFLRNKRHLFFILGVSLLATGFVDWSALFSSPVDATTTVRTAGISGGTNFHAHQGRKHKLKQKLPKQQIIHSSSTPQVHVPSKEEWRNSGSTTINVRKVTDDGDGFSAASASSEDVSTPFPVIDDDNKVPGMSGNGQPLPAAEALDCRESVVEFVINATDARDECDGLRKAFDKTCNSDSAQEILEGKHPTGEHAVPQRRSRRLTDKFANNDNADVSRQWKYHTYKFSRSLRKFTQYLVGRTTQGLFFAEDAIIDEWEDAKYIVQNDLDRKLVKLPTSKRQYYRQHRARELRRRVTNTETITVKPDKVDKTTTVVAKDASEDASIVTTTTTTGATKTTAVTATEHEHKPLASLSLPTTNAHVSGKVLSDTVMLQQQETVIAEAIVRAGNHSTNTTDGQPPLKEAAVDAVRSSNAVAEANAAVSAVLNDPTSIEARTCCASILNVYHENCDFPSGEEVSDRRLFIIIFVIAFCGMVKSLIRHFQIRWLPEAAGCILVGVVGGGIMTLVPHYDLSFDGNWFLRIMVPPIVFEAALSIDKKSFNRHLVPISFFAVFGTLMASAITAVVVFRGSAFLNSWGLCSSIPFIECLTFGALISSIDPIAVLSVLSNIGMTDTDTIYVVIFGESLLNDGVSIVLFQTLVHFLDESLIIDSEAVFAGAMHFLVVALGSLFVGIASGAACTVYYWAMHGCHTPLVEVLMFFCWAFIPYYICDGIEWSGIVAVVATGFVMDLYVVGQEGEILQTGAQTPPTSNVTQQEHGSLSQSKQERRRLFRKIFSKEGHLSTISRTHVGFVTEILATMMETAIFAYLGLFLFSYRYHWNLWHSSIAIFACCVARGIMIPCMSFFANWVTTLQQIRANCRPRQIYGQNAVANGFASLVNKPPGVVMDSRMQLVLFFAGLRGAMSFALVEHIPLYDTVTGEGSRMKPELKAMTSATIVFTVFVMGGYTSYLMERLGLSPASSQDNNNNNSKVEMIGLLRNQNGEKDASPTPSFDMNDVAPQETFRARKKGNSSISDTKSINSI